MTGEELGFLSELLFSAGAVDVYFSAIQMKKNRPAYSVTVLLKKDNLDTITKIVFTHSSTIGFKVKDVDRIEMIRKISFKDTRLGKVRFKECVWNDIKKISFEYEDLKRIAVENNMSIESVKRILIAEL